MPSDPDINRTICELATRYKELYSQRKAALLRDDTAAAKALSSALQRVAEEFYGHIKDRLHRYVKYELIPLLGKQTDWFKDATCQDEFVDNCVHGMLIFILEKLPHVELEEEKGPITYLLTIAANAAKRALFSRSTRLRVVHTELKDVHADPAVDNELEDILDQLYENAFKEAIGEFLLRYAPADRILILGRIAGRPYRDILPDFQKLAKKSTTLAALRKRWQHISGDLRDFLRSKGLID